MAWIKRNLVFVIGAVVSLGLLIFAGYYNYTAWQHKIEEANALDGKYAELKRLNTQNPHPGNDKVDNIALAREQEKELRAALAKAAKYFQPPPPIPQPAGNATNISSSQFTAALRETVNQLTRSAAAASVQLPPEYKFSFSQQFRLLTFAGSLEPLAVQLGEIKVLSELLIKARVNSLDGIQRERMTPDDAAGPVTDYYTDTTSQTNDLAILTPYQVSFRSFSHELAEVLSGLASSPHGFIVQRIRVEPAPAGSGDPGLAPGMQTPFATASAAPAPAGRRTARDIADEEAREAAMLRPDLFKYAGPGSAANAAPVPAYPTPAAVYPGQTPAYGAPMVYSTTPGVRGGPQTVINERQLRVTLLVQVVKLLPRQ